VSSRGALLALVAAAALGASSPGAAAVGSSGLGDPFFPKAGNGGYDVLHYGLELRFRPAKRHLGGSAAIRARALQRLDRFDLDLRGFRVRAVRVDGIPATFSRSGQELVVSPDAAMRNGRIFEVTVRYGGTPHYVVDPDGSTEGWIATGDGAFVAAEPQGSPSWFPCNDYPTDKAAWDLGMTVPRGLVTLSNGGLVQRVKRVRTTTWHWRQQKPMATYLATATTGRFFVRRGTTPSGIPTTVAVDRWYGKRTFSSVRRLPAMVEFFRRRFGAYPFGEVGAIVDHAPSVGYALETQTKPLFSVPPDSATLAHELAHQWLGDAVSPSSWPDIWLNEGFATWSEWLWRARHGGPSLQARFDDLYATPASDDVFWNPPPAALGGPENLFDGTVYDRGAMTLQALREKIGAHAFAGILREWVAEHRYGNASTADFVALAEAETGSDLDAFFAAWLESSGKPTSW